MRVVSAFAAALVLLVLCMMAVSVEGAARRFHFAPHDPKAPAAPRLSTKKADALKASGTAQQWVGADYDYLILAVQKCDDYAPWTMHGLWPSDNDNKDKPSDCGGPAYSHSAIADLWPQITKYWGSCSWSSNTEDEFLSHEWTKHGTCVTSDQHTFFADALEIFEAGGWRSSCSSQSYSKSCQVRVTLPDSTKKLA
jgi:hypothetical protein